MNNKTLIEQLIDLLIHIESDEPINIEEALPDNLDKDFCKFFFNCNGGYTPDFYIHFFGKNGPKGHNIFKWNDVNLWKKYYELTAPIFFFAEDIFGNQYGFDLREKIGTIVMFWVDEGHLIPCSSMFQDFVEGYVFSYETSMEMVELSKQFLKKHSNEHIPVKHICYKHPLLLGGSETDLDNLEFGDAVEHLRLLGQIVTQVRKIPVGTKITQILIDKEKREVKLLTE